MSKENCDGVCGDCENKGKRRRQSTKYVNDEDNYVFVCDACFEEIQAHWADMWSDYYSGCI